MAAPEAARVGPEAGRVHIREGEMKKLYMCHSCISKAASAGYVVGAEIKLNETCCLCGKRAATVREVRKREK